MFGEESCAGGVGGGAGVVEGVEPVVLTAEAGPFGDDAFAGEEALGVGSARGFNRSGGSWDATCIQLNDIIVPTTISPEKSLCRAAFIIQEGNRR